MGKRAGRIFIGTSGWSYNHWRGVFYPEKLFTKEWFDYYGKRFDTVEINNTFYNLPASSVFKSWKKQAPAGFIYSVKANRYITHMKKLKSASGAVKKFFSRVNRLKENLGPVLYQLPPRWKCDLQRLERFLKILPKGKIHVFEFRDNSWFEKEVFDMLDSYNASFCVHDMAGVNCPVEATGKTAYLRFHGPGAKYQGGYTLKALKKWARWIVAQAKKRDVYVYFNNDAEGHAVRDGTKLKALLRD